MAVARQTRPRGPQARAVTVSAPGRSCSVRLTSNEPFGRVVLATPFQATRRSCTSATRQTTPRTAVLDLEPQLDAVVAALQPQLRRPRRCRRHRRRAPRRGRPSRLPRRARPRRATACRLRGGARAQRGCDPERSSKADHTTQSAEPSLRPQRDLGRIGYEPRSPRSPCRSTQRIAWTRSVTPIRRKMLVKCDLTVFSLIPSRRAISLFGIPSSEQGEHLALARRDPGERVGRGSSPRAATARRADRAASRPPRRRGCRAPPPPRTRPSAGSRPRRRRALP